MDSRVAISAQHCGVGGHLADKQTLLRGRCRTHQLWRLAQWAWTRGIFFLEIFKIHLIIFYKKICTYFIICSCLLLTFINIRFSIEIYCWHVWQAAQYLKRIPFELFNTSLLLLYLAFWERNFVWLRKELTVCIFNMKTFLFVCFWLFCFLVLFYYYYLLLFSFI